ncbi:MAG: hypothetical protein ACON4H_08020 [Rubripirellula sp.]
MVEIIPNWSELRDRWGREDWQGSFQDALGPASRDGMAFRWGMAASAEQCCDEELLLLSLYACDAKVSKKLRQIEIVPYLRQWQERTASGESVSMLDAAIACVVAAALPKLLSDLSLEEVAEVGDALVALHEDSVSHLRASDPLRLLLGAELGWLLHCLQVGSVVSGSRTTSFATQKTSFAKQATDAISQWCEAHTDAIPQAIQGGKDLRLVLASSVRCKKLGLLRGTSKTVKTQWKALGSELARWVLAFSGHRGAAGFSAADAAMLRDDFETDGLLDQAIKFDRETLGNAKIAAVARAPKGAGLSWEVSLPDSMLHHPTAKLCSMMAGWNVRRGKLHIDYHDQNVVLQMFSGKRVMLSGSVGVELCVGGVDCQPIGPWEEVCEYSDDDVHYLEIEQDWSGGVVLQRQFVLLRDDRCVLFSDAVIPKEAAPDEDGCGGLGEIQYRCRIPVAGGTEVAFDDEVREVIFSTGSRKVMCLPLGAPEWRVGPTQVDVTVSADQHLVVTASGKERLYTPLWFDFSQRRFARKRTWRQLTVADQLKILDRSEAVGYRIQMGSEQWMIYRSLFGGQNTRTVLGKHLIADFYCARFDSGDGSYDELITVDDHGD